MEKSMMNKIIREICQEEKINCDFFCDNWVIVLSKNEKFMPIYGYKFPNNNAAIEQICDDKSALSALLTFHQIPNVPHFFFRQPTLQNTLMNWPKLKDLLTHYQSLVCKNNNGTGGNDVYKVDNPNQLESIIHLLFKSFRSIAVSPFIKIKNEYRVIVCNNQVKIIYQKIRPFVIGNNKDNLFDLIINKYPDYTFDIPITNHVLAEGEIFLLSWKHNLAKGAEAELITDSLIIEKLSSIAIQCIEKLDIKLASIDIIFDGEDYQVLEINSGVMMEKFAATCEQFYLLAKNIYKEAILTFLT